MGRPVAELQRQISSLEFAQWFAFRQLRPFGPPRVAQERNPQEVYDEMKSALFMLAKVNHGG